MFFQLLFKAFSGKNLLQYNFSKKIFQNCLKEFSAIFWGENDDKKRATLSFGVEDTFLFSLIANLMPSLVLTSMGDFGIFCQYRISLNNMRTHYYFPSALRAPIFRSCALIKRVHYDLY